MHCNELSEKKKKKSKMTDEAKSNLKKLRCIFPKICVLWLFFFNRIDIKDGNKQ